MTSMTELNPEQVQASANNTAACLGELESHLSGMSNAQDEMYAAVKGQTGAAIYKSMGEAYSKGKNLAAKLQEIMEALKETGVKVDASDLDASSQVVAKGLNGEFDGNSADGGGWTSNQQSNIDLKSW